MHKPVLILLISLATILIACSGSHGETELGGYYKNMLAFVHPWAVQEEGEIIDYQRLRLKLDSSPAEWLHIQLHGEVSSIWGEALDTATGLATSMVSTTVSPLATGSRPRFMDLATDIVEEPRFRLKGEIDRLSLKLQTDHCSLSLGRQSVSWGCGSFWSPNDIFSSFSPTEIDKDEKIGSDVIRLSLFPSPNTEIDVVLEPLDRDAAWKMTTDDSAGAIRASGNIAEYDIAACIGRVAGDYVLGMDFSGYLKDAGFHGELLGTAVQNSSEDGYLRLVVGLDYSWQALFDTYLMVEYYFNGIGVSDPDEFLSVLALPSVQRSLWRGTSYNLGRHYLGAVLRLALTPLASLQLQTILNLDDHSFYEYLSLGLSTSENTELILGCGLTIGRAGTEFGGWSQEQIGVDADSPDTFLAYFKAYF